MTPNIHDDAARDIGPRRVPAVLALRRGTIRDTPAEAAALVRDVKLPS